MSLCKYHIISYSVISCIFTFSVGRAIHCSNVQPFIGVPQSKLALYLPKKDFVCFDGSLTIPYDWINDDYCDCPDGSDEPSTSACVNSIFTCANFGFLPMEIPSSRVNDGICDCCDGSDEYCKIVNCTNTCLILRARALAEIESRLELLTSGNFIRNEMSVKGKEIRLEKIIRIAELEEELKEAVEIKIDAEHLKMSWEDKQKALIGKSMKMNIDEVQQYDDTKGTTSLQPKEVFNEMDDNKDGSLQANEILIKLKSLEICESKIKSTLEDEVMYIMNMNSELSFDDFYKISWNRFKVLLTSGNNDVEIDKRDYEKSMSDNRDGVDNATFKYDDETNKVINETINARDIFEKAERAVKEIESHKAYIQSTLEIDYGPEDEFLPLEGECFSYLAASYNYTLCPFEQVYQTALNGGCEIKLGIWEKWEVPSNYTTMIYSRGEECWNGPRRSAKVFVSCGLDNELFGAEEPDKCFYVLNFRTPAACDPTKFKEAQSFIHDEL